MTGSPTSAPKPVRGTSADFGSLAGEGSAGVVHSGGGVPLQRPRLLLMGQRRSGKSSIRQVVFHKLPAYKTLFLEATTRIEKARINSIIGIDIWDLPGQLTHLDGTFDVTEILDDANAIIWVIDAQDDLYSPLRKFQETVVAIGKLYPGIHIEVFIHKVDGIPDDHCLETRAEVTERTEKVLRENGMLGIQVFYHLTSIYDHSVLEAVSRVVQRLDPNLETVESMLDQLCLTSGIQKAFLIDTATKIYVATDSSLADTQNLEICCDYIDFISGITDIYGYERQESMETGSEIRPATGVLEISSKITLSNGMTLHLKEMNRYLVLACIMPKDATGKQGLVDFNIRMFQDGLCCLLGPGKRTT